MIEDGLIRCFNFATNYVDQFGYDISHKPLPVPGGYDFPLQGRHIGLHLCKLRVFSNELADCVWMDELPESVMKRAQELLEPKPVMLIGNSITVR